MEDVFRAYPEQDGGLEAVMRFHAVKRWHMIDTTRAQTLAEHSANVALLAYYIAKTTPEMFFGPAIYIATQGLIHDIPEVFTGDIPSHTKRAMEDGGALERLEHFVTPAVFVEPIDEDAKALIKFCDLADGIRFIRLHGIDATAKHAKNGLESQLEALALSVQPKWPAMIYRKVCKDVTFYAYEMS